MKQYIDKLISNPLFSGSAIMIIGSNSANGLNYLYHFIVAKLLKEPSLYGELVSLISLIGLLGIIPAALNLVIVKEISSAKNDSEARHLIEWFKAKMFIIALIFSILTLIFSPIISSFLNINKGSYLLLVSLFILFSLQSGFNRSILQGILKFKEFIVTLLFENGIKLILSILLIYIGLKVYGALLAFLISGFLGWYLTNLFLRYKKAKLTDFSPHIKSMLKFALPVIIYSAAITSLYTTDVVLVKHYFSAHEAGIYASLSVLGKIIFFATGPISAVMFPLVSKRKSMGQPFKKIFIYSFIMTLIFAAGSLIVYWLFPEFIIRLLYRKEYLGAESLLVWFGIFISLFTLSSLLTNYNLSIGRIKVIFFPVIAALVQIIMIVLFHQTLFTIIIISIVITALLLLTLLIYLIFEKGIIYGKNISTRDKLNLNNRPGI